MAPRRLLQFAGLAAIATLTIDLADALATKEPESWTSRVVLLGFAGLFAAVFVFNTREALARPNGKAVALLGLQLLLAFRMSTHFLIVLAAEIPFVLGGGFGLLAFGIQAIAMTAVTVHYAGTEHIQLWEAARGLPLGVAATLTALGATAWQAFAFFAGYAAASEARARRDLERTNAELRAAQEQLALGSRLAERLRISRELHDRVGHHLTLLSVHIELAKQLAGEREPSIAAALQRARSVARTLLDEVRDVVDRLRSPRSIDLPEALRLLADGIPTPHVELQIPPDFPSLASDAALDLFRAAQEIATNTIRHAGAQTLRLALAADEQNITLFASDDGEGAEPFAKGSGLRGLDERITARGGSVEITATPAFHVRIRLPRQGSLA